VGFFSGISSIAGGLSGLAGGPKTSQGVPAAGFYSMPPGYQEFYNNLSKAANTTLLPNGQPNSAMFTPMAQTADETQAFGMARQGLAPTEESLRKDIALQMNPFDDFVINDINREATGANSLVNQYATQAGQQGSNRSFLGTSDVEQNRLNNIGQFRQGQYNTAVQNALGPMANLKQTDIENLLGIGAFQRGLDTATRQAPYTALSAAGGLLGGMPTQFGTQSQAGTATSGSKTGSILDMVSQGAGIIGSLGGLFKSDERLKENIIKVGEENGHNIYDFNYIDDHQRYTGVMAQEVLTKNPEAVFEEDGFLKVNYDMIGVKMRVHD
jgi:hypothetical protein